MAESDGARMSHASADRDVRKKRRSKLGVERGEHYALIPEDIITSAPYLALPDFARVVLIALAVGCHKNNNGDLSLPFSVARTRGVSLRRKLYAGLRLLELADLIVCTRRGRLDHGHKLASLFALTWRPINPSDKYDGGISVLMQPIHAWARWERPNDWQRQVRAVMRSMRGRSRAEISQSPMWGTGRSPMWGTEGTTTDHPCGVRDPAVSDTHMGDTSKTQGVKGAPKVRKRGGNSHGQD
jgi:hypothetical protein